MIAVTEVDYAEQLKSLDAVLRNVEVVLDLPRMRKEKAELEAAASEPSLWDDPARAQQVTSKLSYASAEINRVEKLRGRLDDAGVLLELAQGEDDPASFAEVGTEIEVGKLDGLQKRIPATVVRFPFYDPEKKRPRS